MPDQSSPTGSQRDIDRRREAEETLRQVTLGSETIASSGHTRSEPPPEGQDDKIEIWGRWIGRSLGVVAVLLILWQLTILLLRAR